MTTEVSFCDCAIFKCFHVNIKHHENYYNIAIYYCVYKEPRDNSDRSKRWLVIQNYYGEKDLCLNFFIIKNINQYL